MADKRRGRAENVNGCHRRGKKPDTAGSQRLRGASGSTYKKRGSRYKAQEQNARSLMPDDMIAGRNAVMEAVKSGHSINKILLAEGAEGLSDICSAARERGIVTENIPRAKLDTITGGFRHQGVAAYAAPVDYTDLDDILERAEKAGHSPFLVLLDELEDPHNLGAILRSADAAGVDGVLIPKRRSVPLSATVAKTSAGAVEYVPVARIGNIVQTMKKLQQRGLWAVGADMDGSAECFEADLTGPLLLVIGGEGRGLGRLVKETCDMIVRIPMNGSINSLNASVAASVLMYESVRQRIAKSRV